MVDECHVCGRPASGRGVVEGVTVWLCRSCMSLGMPVSGPQTTGTASNFQPAKAFAKPAYTAPRPQLKPKEHSIVEDYAAAITHAREKLGLTRKQLANQLFIMENVLERIEHGHLTPDLKTAQKLEKALGIRLVVEDSGKEEKKDSPAPAAGFGGVSMADVVDVKVK
ncbi:MAG: multiprotein bridging factor aMBF1 [Candidatus Micrarchaeota archaeon]